MRKLCPKGCCSVLDWNSMLQPLLPAPLWKIVAPDKDLSCLIRVSSGVRQDMRRFRLCCEPRGRKTAQHIDCECRLWTQTDLDTKPRYTIRCMPNLRLAKLGFSFLIHNRAMVMPVLLVIVKI